MSQSNLPNASSPKVRDWVLVVDDDVPIHELIVTALTQDDLEVVTATGGEKAFEALDERKSEPVLVLTDVLMPGIDGLSLARKLKGRLKHSKIVIMSGHLADVSWWPNDLRELAFLAKPFRMAELTILVQAAREEIDSKP